MNNSNRATDELDLKGFTKSNITHRVFVKNTLGFSHLQTVMRTFMDKPIEELRPVIEDIIAHTMNMMLIGNLTYSKKMAQSLTDKELVKYIYVANSMFRNKHGWCIRPLDIKARLKTYDGRRKRKSTKLTDNKYWINW